VAERRGADAASLEKKSRTTPEGRGAGLRRKKSLAVKTRGRWNDVLADAETKGVEEKVSGENWLFEATPEKFAKKKLEKETHSV